MANVFISKNQPSMAQFKETECNHFMTRTVFKDVQGDLKAGNWKRVSRETFDELKSDFVESQILELN